MSSFKAFSTENLNIELMGENFFRAILVLQPYWKIMTYWLTSSNIMLHWQQNSTSKLIYFWDWLLEMFNLSIDYRRGLEWFHLYHSNFLNFLEWTATKVSETVFYLYRKCLCLQILIFIDIQNYHFRKVSSSFQITPKYFHNLLCQLIKIKRYGLSHELLSGQET